MSAAGTLAHRIQGTHFLPRRRTWVDLSGSFMEPKQVHQRVIRTSFPQGGVLQLADGPKSQPVKKPHPLKNYSPENISGSKRWVAEFEVWRMAGKA